MYHTMAELDALFPNNFEVLDTAIKLEDHLDAHRRILAPISGGSDSDILLDLVERLGYESQVTYVFYNTGLEYQATKDHIRALEGKYGITILERPARVPIPVSCKRFGQPFLSKKVSDYIERLQRHNFCWTDEPFDALYARYPKCRAALRWWCNCFQREGEEDSQFNIKRHRWLKEFMVANPPDFRISGKCCDGAKKSVGDGVIAELSPDLLMVGVRKAEGGARATAYNSCFTPAKDTKVAQFRPLFYWKNADKAQYAAHCGVCHSRCYTVYGLKRTGCACCPFGREFETELLAARLYEPLLFQAANHIFGDSYSYTRRYRAFAAEREAEQEKPPEEHKAPVDKDQIWINGFKESNDGR